MFFPLYYTSITWVRYVKVSKRVWTDKGPGTFERDGAPGKPWSFTRCKVQRGYYYFGGGTTVV